MDSLVACYIPYPACLVSPSSLSRSSSLTRRGSDSSPGRTDMPDVTTHLLFGISAALLVCRNRLREEDVLLRLGSLLIYTECPVSILLKALSYTYHDLTAAFHSLLSIIAIPYAGATAFQMEDVDFVSHFKLLLMRAILHLCLDLTLHPWPGHGLYLVYPLKISYSFGLVWSDYPYFPLFALLAFAIAFLLHATLDQVDSKPVQNQ